MPLRRLVLFDIDGTLIQGGPLWRESFEKAFLTVYPKRNLSWTSFNGKTDGQIIRELIDRTGGPEKDLAIEAHRVLSEYLRLAKLALETRAHEVAVLPGIREVVAQMKGHTEIFLGLLTGNMKLGAELKLATVGLHDEFKFGVYADHHWDRYQLPAIAVSEAFDLCGRRFEGKEVVIIGDTVHDVNCGKSIGVKSIAVGTGRGIVREELLAASPDYFFENLANTDQVLEAVLA